MLFRAKRDSFFMGTISICLFIISAAYLLPLFLDPNVTTGDTIIVLSLFLLTVAFLFWSAFSIKYIFTEKYLFVKGGMFRRKIPYGEITKVAPTKDIYTGFRILSSRDAIEVSYQSSLMGGVKISPLEKERFIEELKKHCPHIRVAKY